MSWLFRNCIRNRTPGSVTTSGIVRGTPLIEHEDLGNGVSVAAHALFADACDQALRGYTAGIEEDHEEVPPEQDAMYVPVMDYNTGGMYVTGASVRQTSFFTEGVKFVDPKTHQVMVCTSTATSNRQSTQYASNSWANMELWASHADGHTLEGGQGMDAHPRMSRCSPCGLAGTYFHDVGMWQNLHSLEDALDAAKISGYARFICGFHIKDRSALSVCRYLKCSYNP